MPFFEIANAQFSLQYNLCSLKVQTPYHGKLSSVSFAFCNEHSAACAWKSLGRFRPLIKAIATILEPNNLVAMEDKCLGSKDLDLGLSPNPREVLLESSVEESEEPDEKERLRRMKISKANKGQAAWNKGRKHSPETLRKIKERTRLAMQNPKIKMKLANIRHPQTIETRLKIAAGVKMRCKRRRERKVVQETCCFKWQNLIAETSRRGYADQEELQWNSFEILNEQLELEWLASVRECKTMPREPGSNRAPKTLEHRRKIAAAISAKWADPEYVNKVYSAKGKHHDTERAERKPRRRPIDGAQSIRKNPIVKMNANLNVKSDTKFLNYVRLKKSMSSPSFKDPLVSSKLEMLKTIRVQRSAADTELTKTIQQARLLIAEAEKAAQALEFATTKSHIAQTSLIETRQLIAEAIQSLESIDAQGIVVSNIPSSSSSEVKKENDADFEALNQSHKDPVNGHETLSSSDYKFYKDLGKVSLQKFVDGDSEQLHPTSINGFVSIPVGFNCKIEQSSSSNQQCQTEHEHSSKYKIHTSSTVLGIQSIKDEKQPISPTVTKKWVCGRLVEVVKQ